MNRAFTAIKQLEAAPTNDALQAIVDLARSEPFTDEETAHLAEVLASSGVQMPANASDRSADVASTGGPSSLSTLLCPLYLLAAGFRVPKLAVPGRPAGGVDVLAQVPGYRVHLTTAEIEACLSTCGYAHFLASDRFAPLDAELFRFRQAVGAQHVPALVTASLLAKKIAVGVRYAGLDIRVGPHGNFGATWSEARLNAQQFCRVARCLNVHAACFLTDGSRPYQPYIGRAEALIALTTVFQGGADPWLSNHAAVCFAMACGTVPAAPANCPTGTELERYSNENLVAQGGSVEGLQAYVAAARRQHTRMIETPSDGFLGIDPYVIRNAIVTGQRKLAPRQEFPDPCGIILKSAPGDFLCKGRVLATVRCPDDLWPELEILLAAAFDLSPSPPRDTPFEEIRDA